MTTGKWNQPGVPHNGWRCIGMKDLGDREPRLKCEMCEVHSIRYVHEMQHDDYPDIPLLRLRLCRPHGGGHRRGAGAREGV